MIAFIDTEVNPQTKKVEDYGAVMEDGAVPGFGLHRGDYLLLVNLNLQAVADVQY